MNVFYRLPEGFPLEEAVQRFPQIFRPRQADSHKGTFGTLAVLGGAAGMSGAVVLASSSALMLGCGKVWAGFHQPVLPMPLIAAYPEIMLDTASALLKRTDLSARVAGCGLGCAAEAAQLLRAVFQTASDTPLLLDADALNLLAHDGALAAEAARLLGTETSVVQSDRETAVRRLAERFRAVVVLKGHRSLVCGGNGMLYENLSGNAGLATAGSGDVLSGIIGSLLAQGVEPFQAACGGVWLHGAAADVLRASGAGEIGLLAGEIAPAARWLRNQTIENKLQLSV